MITRARKQFDSIASLLVDVFRPNFSEGDCKVMRKKIGVAYHHWLVWEAATGEMFCKKRFPYNIRKIDMERDSNRPATLLKRRLRHRCFPGNFAKFLRTPFFTEHLRKTASVAYNLCCLRLLSRVLALVITQIFNFWFLIFISVREFSADHKWENSSCILWEVIDSIFSFASFVHQLKRNEMEHFQKIFQEQLSSVTYFCLTQRSFEYRVFSFDYLQEHFKWN